MSNDLQTRTPSPPLEPPAPKASKLDLSVSKVVGGALAAMTAAGLGSRLSVAGTLIGAALASVIAAVAGALYTASLHRTQEKVRTVWTGRVAGSDVPTAVDALSDSTRTATGWTVAEPTSAHAVAGVTSGGRPPRRGLNWKGIAAGTFAMFAIAAVALTGFELISGHALSGGNGTTITQVSEAKEPKPTPTPKPTASVTSSPSGTLSETPSPEPTAVGSSTPQPSPAPTTAPTPSASQVPSAAATQASPVPSASASQ